MDNEMCPEICQGSFCFIGSQNRNGPFLLHEIKQAHLYSHTRITLFSHFFPAPSLPPEYPSEMVTVPAM